MEPEESCLRTNRTDKTIEVRSLEAAMLFNLTMSIYKSVCSLLAGNVTAGVHMCCVPTGVGGVARGDGRSSTFRDLPIKVG